MPAPVDGQSQAPAAAAAAAQAAPSTSPPPSTSPVATKHTDKKAAEYFSKRWTDKAATRLKDIRSVGGYLRIYTDLPESANNSKEALTLCERGLEYLKEAGVEKPVVFVQAEFGENGNPVLANVLGPSDKDCRVTHPDPG